MLGSSSAKSQFSEESNSSSKRSKLSRQDPTSHRIIEKRRRDRMNNCLSDLSNLIPPVYLRKGQTRVEKTEIIELAIRLIVTLNSQLNRCQEILGNNFPKSSQKCCQGQYYHGFMACQADVLRYLFEKEGLSANDALTCNLRDYLHEKSQSSLPELSIHPIDLFTSDRVIEHHESNCDNNAIKKSNSCDKIDNAIKTPIPLLTSNAISLERSAVDESVKPTNLLETDTFLGQQPPARFFKYKQDIKLRFHADSNLDENDSGTHIHRANKDSMPRPPAVKLDPHNHSVPTTNEIKQSTNSVHQHQSGHSGQLNSQTATNASEFLPGFVLNSAGTYYDPILIDPELIEPRRMESTNESVTLFHPISIPVNFKAAQCVTTVGRGAAAGLTLASHEAKLLTAYYEKKPVQL